MPGGAKRWIGALAVAGALTATGAAALAQTQSQPARTAVGPAASLLPTQAEKERFHRLSEELRCLVCQNQTLADSDAELAADLRREVEQLMLAGRSDDEIKSWLVDRYGDFVLYRPPLQRNTWFLWLGPFILLGSGGLLWWRISGGRDGRRKAAGSASTDAGPPDDRDEKREAAAARARALLDDAAGSGGAQTSGGR